MRKLFVLTVLCALLLAACAPTAAPAPAPPAPSGEPESCKADWGCAKIAKDQTVKIGMAGPLSGDYAAYGQDVADAMKLAIKDAGDLQGWKFELAAGDDGGGSEGGAAVANKFVSDPTFVAMAGHAFSGSTAAAIPIYEKAGIPMLSPSATNPDLTANASKVFNRNAFTDNDQASFAADFLGNNLGVKKLAIIHDGSDYGQGLAKTVQDKFTKGGGQVVSFSAITSGETDYTAPLAAVAASKPDGLYFGGYNADASVIANQKKQAGLDEIPFMGGDGMYGKDFLTKAGANGEGTYVTTLVPAGSTAKDAFDKAFKEAYGVDAGVRSGYTWNSYDAAAALIQAVKSVAKVSGDTLYIPRAELTEAVRGLKDFRGIASVISCQQNGECNASGPVLYVVKNGAWVPVQE